MKPTEKIAIANRGEVAVRIIRACQELGLRSVLLHSDVDKNTLAYRLSDEQICIGGGPSAESYLNIANVIKGAKASGAIALHPGFGFLSENADFCEQVEKAGIRFVGPTADSIRAVGDKIAAKALAKKLGITMVPGYDGDDQSLPRLLKEAERIGTPLIVKAAAGGGGRGMKLITDLAHAQEQIESAQREAQAAFNSPIVFLEKYLDRAKHIEIQIFGDGVGNVVHLNERECSVQRRHQKIIEEATSSNLDPISRERMADAALALGRSVSYRGAGTVEFLWQDGLFYFLEVNTRLQVEHPVTELVVGVDLVKAQLELALNRFFLWPISQLLPRGHSMEVRLCTEDPYQGGTPSIGRLGGIQLPHGPGRRFDMGFESGDEITPYYDSMIGKIIVWDETRSRTIQKMRQVLRDTIVFGLKTNIPLCQQILRHPDFVSGAMTTQFMTQHFSKPLQKRQLPSEIVDYLRRTGGHSSTTSEAAVLPNPWQKPWSTL